MNSGDLNDIQDMIIGAKRPKFWTWTNPLGRAASEVNLAWDMTDISVFASPGPASLSLVPVDVMVGDKITKIAARVIGTGAGGNVVVRLRRNNGDGTGPTTLATLTIVTPAAAWARFEAALGAEETVADAVSYYLEADLATTNQKIGNLGFESYR